MRQGSVLSTPPLSVPRKCEKNSVRQAGDEAGEESRGMQSRGDDGEERRE